MYFENIPQYFSQIYLISLTIEVNNDAAKMTNEEIDLVTYSNSGTTAYPIYQYLIHCGYEQN
jgi:hypothetical protein